MKKIILLTVTVLIILQIHSVGLVSALNTGFETETINEDLQQTILSNRKLTVFYSEPNRSTIECFDVNDNGLIALGSSKSKNKRICVYDTNGDFKYGYEFVDDGDFGVEWDGDNLNIYFCRGDIIASFDRNGQCIGILSVKNTSDNNSYFRLFFEADERIVGDKKYVISNDIGLLGLLASSYSKLAMIDSDGKITVLYDVGDKQFANILGMLILSIIFITIAFSIFYIRLKKEH